MNVTALIVGNEFCVASKAGGRYTLRLHRIFVNSSTTDGALALTVRINKLHSPVTYRINVFSMKLKEYRVIYFYSCLKFNSYVRG